MKTPNLDKEIETYEIHKKKGYLTKDGENYLAEFKAIKQALIIADVVEQSEQLLNRCKVCGRTDEERLTMTSMCGVSVCPY